MLHRLLLVELLLLRLLVELRLRLLLVELLLRLVPKADMLVRWGEVRCCRPCTAPNSPVVVHLDPHGLELIAQLVGELEVSLTPRVHSLHQHRVHGALVN